MNSENSLIIGTNKDLLSQHFAVLASTPTSMAKLRELILHLAIRGKLVSQDLDDEPATILLERIRKEKERLIKEGIIQKNGKYKPIDDERLPFDIPKSWQWSRLEEITQKIGSGSTPKGGKSVYQKIGIPFIRSQNVWNDGLSLNGVAFISSAIHSKMSATQVRPRDILLNITGASIGRSCIVPDNFNEGNVSQHVSIIRTIEENTRQYLHYCIISEYFQRKIMDVQVGISREGLSKRVLKDLLIPLPPLAEQYRIVEKVDHLIALCDTLEAQQRKEHEQRVRHGTAALTALQNAKDSEDLEKWWGHIAENFEEIFDCLENVEVLRKTILQLAVRGKLGTQDARDEPANIQLNKKRKLKSIKPMDDEEIPFTIPEKWRWIRVGNLGFTQTGTTPSKSNPDFFGNYIPFIKPADITNNGLNYNGEGLSEEGLKEGRLIPKNSIIMVCIGGSIGKSGLVTKDISCNQQINALTPYENLNPKYFFIAFRSTYFQTLVWKFATGGCLPITNKSKWEQIPVPLPPLAEQHRIVEKVDALMALCDKLETQIREREAAQERFAKATINQIVNAPIPTIQT